MGAAADGFGSGLAETSDIIQNKGDEIRNSTVIVKVVR